jgi:three-Cys-motif partner protein
MKNETLFGTEDGLPMVETGSYAEDKYDLVRLYCQLFSTGMKDKWRGKRTYLDLYAGPGQCRIKENQKILLGSPLIALSVPDPFDHYVFCERDDEFAEALSRRVSRAERKISIVRGDCNDSIDRLNALIPADNLVLCFVDPFDIGISLRTIRQISSMGYGVDFLFLLAFQMDAARGDNPRHYSNPKNTKVDNMLGQSSWRERWDSAQRAGDADFARFLAVEFSGAMKSLQYLNNPIHRMKRIRTHDKNVPLYYLALYSRHATALKYWDQVLKYSTPQRGLFDD